MLRERSGSLTDKRQQMPVTEPQNSGQGKESEVKTNNPGEEVRVDGYNSAHSTPDNRDNPHLQRAEQ